MRLCIIISVLLVVICQFKLFISFEFNLGRSHGCATLFMGRYEQTYTHPDEKATTNQSKDSSNVPPGESMSFIGNTNKRLGER